MTTQRIQLIGLAIELFLEVLAAHSLKFGLILTMAVYSRRVFTRNDDFRILNPPHILFALFGKLLENT